MRRVLAIDMGGTKTAAGVVDEGGRILAKRTVPTPRESPRAAVDAILALSREIQTEAGPVESAGLALPGVVDRARGVLVRSASSGWTEVPFAAMVSDALGLPVASENDVNACALAEARFGGGRNLEAFFWMTISTGIGGAVCSRGRIIGGSMSGEIGHLVVNPGGASCGCGNRGCLEAEAAGPAWRRRALDLLAADAPVGVPSRNGRDSNREANSFSVDARDVAEGARAGDPACLRVVEDCARFLAAGLAAVFNLLDPDAVFVGGGVAGAFDLLEPILRRELPPLVLAGRDRPLPVLKSFLGYDAALVGAAVPALFPYSS
jgi:glucokinase